jgi:hypothetical protein
MERRLRRGRVEKFSLGASLDLLSIHCSRSPERQVRPIIHRVLVVGGQDTAEGKRYSLVK